MTSQYGEVGPSVPGFKEDCEQIKAVLTNGQSVRFLYSHLMTGYRVFLTPLAGVAWYGSAMPGGSATYVQVSIEGHGSYPFEGPGWIDPGYIGEKLGLRFEGDVEGIAKCLELMLP